MDNIANQSQGGDSSINTNQSQGNSSESNVPTPFVNHGLLLWNQNRQHWVQNRKSGNRKQVIREPKLHTHCLCMPKSFWLCSWSATYDSLLGNNKPFPQPIPLGEMVDFLVDIWEQEGLYD
ncbi:uncharacterized protein LOC103494700 isoform X1 [Cucumis melo]|uniref:Uncharacterized protein LOC103494700 isoform X1 n=1 Tax=Cucumis melo TaxID=3656 RepID=A0A1S3BY48_CUCME|nr:uncharacterized protein LOC103494700 isoform X1 [Cucumis melo]XP_008454231.1 uncharacterized protein LOC103494700 isoform X1 [Cucumis melo]XP_008454232.1 uncharacterized protein LOC103494700 isoform X1 [Cucumis melo]XP_050943370.1 uncharacterized protein LOC103494700 isoform X1 [Cucumis melo]XP_050943371.1 uncharacterized protein LOC103494700 isoform X1 [Cucumis melo]XP_050943372.1 uncharacterized protein LOC103494700 isoform X1 [Cucumis melo]